MILRGVFLFLFLFNFADAQNMNMKKMFQSVDVKKVDIKQTGKDKMYCPNCGMYLPKFWKTSHAVEFKDGTYRQFCSIHCLVEQLEITELRDKKDKIKRILVVDVDSLKYIDVKKAFYVVGSSRSGTMTTVSKYAFASKNSAMNFAKKFGGKITDFDGAYTSSLKGFTKDMGMLSAKRSTKMYKMGKMIYNKKCDKNALGKIHAHTMGEMKAQIRDSRVCGKNLKDAQLQAVMLYFWDIKLNKFEENYGDNKEIKSYAKQFQKKFKKMRQGE